MRKLSVITFLLFYLISCNTPEKPDQYTISGKIDGDFTGKVYLLAREDGSWVDMDSVNVENGAFIFEGTITSPEMQYISFQDVSSMLPIFIENSIINVTAIIDSLDLTENTVEGSATHDTYSEFKKMSSEIDDKMEALYSAYKEAKKSNDTVRIEQLDEDMETLDAQEKKFIVKYIMNNPKSVVSAYLTYRNGWRFKLDELEKIIQNFDPAIDNSTYVDLLNKRVNTLKRVSIGQPAVDFTMNDPEGNPVTLSDLFGNYLLVDFWASWCGPCRRENPHVVAAYQKYHEKGFDVLGVSFDKKRDAWLEAVEKDQLIWTNVSDLKYWGNEAGRLYGVRSIPSNVLLDPDGMIIAKNLKGEELTNKLKEVLSE